MRIRWRRTGRQPAKRPAPTSTNPANHDSTTVVVYRGLIVGTVAVAIVTFTISFVGLRDYGIRLMGLPEPLAPLAPIGVDVFSICGIAATYLLRHAPWRVRAYAWAVFLVPSALSILGNLAHADAKHLPNSGRVGAAVAPILLALSAHLVIVARRWAFGDSDQTPTGDSGILSTDGTSGQLRDPEVLSPDDASRQPDRRPHNATPDEIRVATLAALLAGATYEDAATDARVSVRTVQRWHRDAVAEVEARSRRARTTRRAGQRPGGPVDSAPTSGAPVGAGQYGADADVLEPADPRQRLAPDPDDRINGTAVPALVNQTN